MLAVFALLLVFVCLLYYSCIVLFGFDCYCLFATGFRFGLGLFASDGASSFYYLVFRC